MLRHFKLHVLTVYSESPCHCAASLWHSGTLPGCSACFPSSTLPPDVSSWWSHPFSRLLPSPRCGWIPGLYLSPLLSPQVQTCIRSCLLFSQHWKRDVNTSVRFITSRHSTSPRPHRLYPEFLSLVSLMQATAETWRFLRKPCFLAAPLLLFHYVFPSAPVAFFLEVSLQSAPSQLPWTFWPRPGILAFPPQESLVASRRLSGITSHLFHFSALPAHVVLSEHTEFSCLSNAVPLN